MFTRISANIISCAASVIEESVAEFVQAEAGATIDNDGIGSYEFWGYRGSDRGNDSAVVEDGSLLVKLAVSDVLSFTGEKSVSDLTKEHFIDGLRVNGFVGGVEEVTDGIEWIVEVTVKSFTVTDDNIDLMVEWSQV